MATATAAPVLVDAGARTSSLGVAAQAVPEPDPNPVIESLSPDTLPVPGADHELSVLGSGFTEESIIVWNNGEEPTEYVDEGTLKTIVKPSTVQAPLPFTLPVYVRNEDLQSNAVSFTFTQAEAKGAKKAAPEEKHAKHGHKKH